jgi:GNAT superfamily N-acetyltransferase
MMALIIAQAGAMSIEIVPFDGAPASAAALCQIAAACELADCRPAEALERLAAPTARAWLAWEAGQILGFVATFEIEAERVRRLEVDLLGVAPAARRRGAATALIRQAVAGWGGPARALIRVGNVASERAFLRVGFRPAGGSATLLVCPAIHDCASGEIGHREDLLVQIEMRGPSAATCKIVGRAGVVVGICELLLVTTLSGHQVWIESAQVHGGDEAAWRVLAGAAARWAGAKSRELAGAVLPESETLGRRAFGAAGYRAIGQYRVFQMDPADSTARQSCPT